MDSDFREQLQTLRALTQRTGVLHEAQVLNLRMWGAMTFSYVGNGHWQAELDVEKKTVTYALTPPPRTRRPTNLPQLIAGLVGSVQWLLGGDWAVRVTEWEKVIFQGEPAPDVEREPGPSRRTRRRKPRRA